MSQQEPGYAKDFRRRLDELLRRTDPAALREFLIAEGQWQPDTTVDAEKALWMMIAGSPKLADLHPQAERWLNSHGYEVEAQAILGRRAQKGSTSQPQHGGRGGGRAGGSGAGGRGGRGTGQAKRPPSQPHGGSGGSGNIPRQPSRPPAAPSRPHTDRGRGTAGGDGQTGGGTSKRPPRQSRRPAPERPR